MRHDLGTCSATRGQHKEDQSCRIEVKLIDDDWRRSLHNWRIKVYSFVWSARRDYRYIGRSSPTQVKNFKRIAEACSYKPYNLPRLIVKFNGDIYLENARARYCVANVTAARTITRIKKRKAGDAVALFLGRLPRGIDPPCAAAS
jgi:hypothetical protein